LYPLVKDEIGYLWVGIFFGARQDLMEQNLRSTIRQMDFRVRLLQALCWIAEIGFRLSSKGVSKMEGGRFMELPLENRGLQFRKMYELLETLYL